MLLPEKCLAKLDILILTKTWSTSQITLPSFYSVSCPATRLGHMGRPSGGVAVLYNERLGDMRTLLNEDNCIVLSGERLNIIAMYVRPQPNRTASELHEKLVGSIQLLDAKPKTLLAGVLNTRLDRHDDAETKAFRDTLSDLGLWIANDPWFTTFRGPQGSWTIDLFATNLDVRDTRFLADEHPLREGEELTWHVPVGLEIRLRRQPPDGQRRRVTAKRPFSIEKLLRLQRALSVIDEPGQRLRIQ